ncbi:MAG: hypothetical protein IKN55_10680 [Oscillospiraceae bacterium]|nr:hypothetical protein [Oscillospiraceae bacterium]
MTRLEIMSAMGRLPPLRQHRTKPACRLGGTSACIFSVILHRNSLLGASPAASFLYNLTKDLTAHLHHQLCAVLPYIYSEGRRNVRDFEREGRNIGQ